MEAVCENPMTVEDLLSEEKAQLKYEEVLEKLREALLEERMIESTFNKQVLKTRFLIGDLFLNAQIITGLKASECRRRVLRDLKIDYHEDKLRKAELLARVYIQSHRKVLLEYGVSYKKCMTLVSKEFDSTRTQIISKIKRGEFRHPFPQITSRSEKLTSRKKEPFHAAALKPDDHIAIRLRRDGEVDPDGVMDALCNLISQVGVEVFNEALKKAMARVMKGEKSSYA